MADNSILRRLSRKFTNQHPYQPQQDEIELQQQNTNQTEQQQQQQHTLYKKINLDQCSFI